MGAAREESLSIALRRMLPIPVSGPTALLSKNRVGEREVSLDAEAFIC